MIVRVGIQSRIKVDILLEFNASEASRKKIFENLNYLLRAKRAKTLGKIGTFPPNSRKSKNQIIYFLSRRGQIIYFQHFRGQNIYFKKNIYQNQIQNQMVVPLNYILGQFSSFKFDPAPSKWSLYFITTR